MRGKGTIYLVDDDSAIREGLGALLDANGYAVSAFARPQTFLKEVDDLEKHAAGLFDVRMPGMSGLELQEKLRELNVDLPLIIMTGHGDIAMAVGAMKAGAVDFLEKPFSNEDLLGAIERALAHAHAGGETSPNSEVAQKLTRLTERESQVLHHLIEGQANKVIAYELGISPRTVEIHRARVMEKMQAKNLADLVRMSVSAGVDRNQR